MFDYLPHIDLQKPESIGDHFSSYLGKDGNLTDLYNGCATCVSPNRGLVGEAARMISGIEERSSWATMKSVDGDGILT